MILPRMLEPEVMDSEAEARDYDDMDHAAVNRQFVDDLLFAGDVCGNVLDLGTGTALIPIELCQRVEGCRIVAIDMSVAMLDCARYNIEAASLIERITLRRLDAKAVEAEDELFDVVMSNSIIHHIAKPSAVLRDAVRITKPGGRVFFRDLLRPTDDATVRQLVKLYAGSESEHQQQMFDDSLRAALSIDEMRDLVDQIGFSPDDVQMTSDRHWTWSATKQVPPE
jgi:ubiquinone/menaquinone biosynthesis C-methylase UbiE